MESDRDKLLEMYRRMSMIRRFEEQTWNVYTRGLMSGLAHLYIGEEAVAVGVCSALRREDSITSTHRGHGHCIAKGGELYRMMAEIMGKATGYCKGKGGSMHIFDMKLGILGANGIVGGSFGIATGAALSAKMQGTDRVTACFFGDGAANQGVWLEVMNLAAIWQLPVIYVCENNQYGEYTPMNSVTAGESIAARAVPFGIPSCQVDGTDVLAVHEAASEAVARARSGDGPGMIECITYRFRGHHVGDPGLHYRNQEEIDAWMKRDCIRKFHKRLVDEGTASEETLKAIDDEVQREAEEAVEKATADPMPDPSEVLEDLHA
jgi:pyruvate dehydrogenase E1 component alpha subunit